MQTAKSAFFNTRDTKRIRLAHALISHPHEYCLKPYHQSLLDEVLPKSISTHRLLEILKSAQSTLASCLPLNVDNLWARRDMLPSCITTTAAGSNVGAVEIEGLARLLDHGLLEEVVETIPSGANGTTAPEVVRQALACAWLSQHFALIALGLAQAELSSADELVITPNGPRAAQHLRRLWFATAFEGQSLQKAQISLDLYARLASREKGLIGDVRKAFADASSMIPQHWRLPFHEGPVDKLSEDWLQPLIWLAGVVLQAERVQPGQPVRLSDVPHRFRPVFEAVQKDQASRRPLDRAFDLHDNGLLRGPRKIAPGLLMIAEGMATNLLGPTWHDKKLSDVQKRYLIERLKGIPHLEVHDVEIMQGDTVDDTHVDVDLFVRDKRQDILFAIQLKHLEYTDKGGLRHWLSRFRDPKDKLAHGVAQLEAFPHLAKSDAKVRRKLHAAGIDPDKLGDVLLVLLHNVGVLDFLEFQNGVLTYDQQTFVNVLKGRAAVGVGVSDGHAVHLTLEGAPTALRLDDPESIIAAYLRDPNFADIKDFDVTADVWREAVLSGSTVRAKGLGI